MSQSRQCESLDWSNCLVVLLLSAPHFRKSGHARLIRGCSSLSVYMQQNQATKSSKQCHPRYFQIVNMFTGQKEVLLLTIFFLSSSSILSLFAASSNACWCKNITIYRYLHVQWLSPSKPFMDTLFYNPYKTYKFFTSMITFLHMLWLNFYVR